MIRIPDKLKSFLKNPVVVVLVVFVFSLLLNLVSLVEDIKDNRLLADPVEVLVSSEDPRVRVQGVTRNDVIYDFDRSNLDNKRYVMEKRYLKAIRVSDPELLDSVHVKSGQANLIYNREEIEKFTNRDNFLEITFGQPTFLPLFRDILNYKGDRALLIELVSLIVLTFFGSFAFGVTILVLYTIVKLPDPHNGHDHVSDT